MATSDTTSSLAELVAAIQQLGGAVSALRTDVDTIKQSFVSQQPAPAQPAGEPATYLQVASTPSALALSKPWLFTGKPRELDPWLEKVEINLAEKRVPGSDPRSILYAVSYFDRTATDWWLARKLAAGGDPYGGFSCFGDFKEAVERQFGEKDGPEKARQQLRRLSQAGSVSQYAARFRQLILQLPERHESDRISDFMAGLKPEVRTHVALQRLTTLDACMEAAEIADRVHMAARASTRFPSLPARPRASGAFGGGASGGGPTSMDLDVLRAAGRVDGRAGAGRGQGRAAAADHSGDWCNYCHEKGHWKRECPALRFKLQQQRAFGRKN